MRILQYYTNRVIHTRGNKYNMDSAVIDRFKRKLHVAVIVVVIEVVAPVMHGDKIDKSQVVTIFLVLRIMLEQNRDLEQLLKKTIVRIHYKNKYVYIQPGHEHKNKRLCLINKIWG